MKEIEIEQTEEEEENQERGASAKPKVEGMVESVQHQNSIN